MSRAAIEDQVKEHLPTTSGSNKEESLLQRAERAIKETLSSAKGKVSDGEDSVKSGIQDTKGKLHEGQESATSGMQDTLSSAKGKLDEGKESVKSGMQDTLSSAKGKLNEGQESVKSGVGSVTGGGEADDNSDSLFSTVKKTIMGDKSSDESGSSEEKNEEGWFSRNVKEPLQGTMETVKHPARDTAAVDE